jgi:folate-binding Fe-S cluster repair protein YgfZ
MAHRTLLRRRLVPVRVDGPLPAPGTPVIGQGREQGEVRSGRDDRALALLRLEALGAGGLAAGEARLEPEPPAWLAAALAAG